MTQLKPYFEQVQAHYDLSDEFFALFLDPSRTYSCAYFDPPDLTLEQAQHAKIDLALGKCALRPGMRLLDIGCGWGSTALRAATHCKVNVIGLTLSRNQQAYASAMMRDLPRDAGSVEIRLQGWEQFDEPIDRIVSIGAFEHFRIERYPAFFTRCRSILPADGRMLLHTIVQCSKAARRERGVEITHDDIIFAKFIRTHIFPGGQLCTPEVVVDHAQRAGFRIERVHALQPHYARTLDCWAANLQAAREKAIALTSQEVYDRYMHYLTGCADQFRRGLIDVVQFTLTVE